MVEVNAPVGREDGTVAGVVLERELLQPKCRFLFYRHSKNKEI
jgi:hypothetical protein